MVSVFVVFSSVTVMEVAVTLVIVGALLCGGASFFFDPQKAPPDISIPRRIATTTKRCFFIELLLVEWHFRQNRWLDKVFGFFHLFIRIHGLAAGINQTRGHEDHQVPFDVLLGIGP